MNAQNQNIQAMLCKKIEECRYAVMILYSKPIHAQLFSLQWYLSQILQGHIHILSQPWPYRHCSHISYDVYLSMISAESRAVSSLESTTALLYVVGSFGHYCRRWVGVRCKVYTDTVPISYDVYLSI